MSLAAQPMPPAQPAAARHRVVIVGGGFAGLTEAMMLAREPNDLVVIDRRNHHVFQPLLCRWQRPHSLRPISQRQSATSLASA